MAFFDLNELKNTTQNTSVWPLWHLVLPRYCLLQFRVLLPELADHFQYKLVSMGPVDDLDVLDLSGILGADVENNSSKTTHSVRYC